MYFVAGKLQIHYTAVHVLMDADWSQMHIAPACQLLMHTAENVCVTFSIRQGALSLDDDPAFNPVLLPPRTRADVVQDRPAGGTPEEVAAANPGLAAAVPAAVAQSGPTPGDTVGEVTQLNTQAQTEGEAPKSGTAGGAAAGPAVAGAGLHVEDGSGMEVPELAVQAGWSK